MLLRGWRAWRSFQTTSGGCRPLEEVRAEDSLQREMEEVNPMAQPIRNLKPTHFPLHTGLGSLPGGAYSFPNSLEHYQQSPWPSYHYPAGQEGPQPGPTPHPDCSTARGSPQPLELSNWVLALSQMSSPSHTHSPARSGQRVPLASVGYRAQSSPFSPFLRVVRRGMGRPGDPSY